MRIICIWFDECLKIFENLLDFEREDQVGDKEKVVEFVIIVW